MRDAMRSNRCRSYCLLNRQPFHLSHKLMFIFDETYDRDNSLPPQDIREDFSGLTFEHGMDPQTLLDQLACYLPADKLREFMDDLANGRV